MLRLVKFFQFSLCILSLSAIAFSAPSTGKVRSVLGDVDRQKEKQTSWVALRVGAKVIQSDRVRTGMESELVLTLADGSIVTVTEHSEIVVAELIEDKGKSKTSLEIKSGRLNFSAQKQAKNSSFSFKTVNAVAAIRGTQGVIGVTPIFFAGLSEGSLAIKSNTNNQEIVIGGGQTVFDKDSLVAVNLLSSGDPAFAGKLEALFADTTLILDSLLVRMHQLDEEYQKHLREKKKTIHCEVDALPDTVFSSMITTKGHCDGLYNVSLFGEHIAVDKNGAFSASIQLDSSAYGIKSFPMTCTVNSVSVACGEVHTTYVSRWVNFTENFEVETPSPDSVCNGGLVVKGTYRTLDTSATIFLRIGKAYQSGNLMHFADGNDHSFTQKVLLNDMNQLWNERQATVIFQTKKGTESREIALDVDKTCSGVNQKSPVVKFHSYDSLRCTASVGVSAMEGDVALFSVEADGSPVSEEALTKNGQLKVSLVSGIHDYSFTAKDQANNKASVHQKLGCFPLKRFSIDMEGGSSERLRVPPPPVGMADQIVRTLGFRVRLAENDPLYLYKVVVKQNGREILRESLSQIQSLDYQIPVELHRNVKNSFDIEVTHKSGYVVRSQKTYEVR